MQGNARKQTGKGNTPIHDEPEECSAALAVERRPPGVEGETVVAQVKVQGLVEALDVQSEMYSCYLDRETGEICTVSEDAFRIAEDEEASRGTLPDWQWEEVELARRIAVGDRYLALPTSWDVHEWEIMRQFSDAIAEDRVRGEFLAAIHGRGAFRQFKDLLSRHGMWEAWDAFRCQALREQVIAWCRQHGVAYEA
jgi:hypothetical protein